MEPVLRRSGFAPPQTPLTRRLLVYFRSGAYNELHIPMVFFFNDPFAISRRDLLRHLRQNSRQIFTQDSLSHTLLGLGGVRDQTFYRSDLDLSSSEFRAYPPVVLDRDTRPMNLEGHPLLELLP